MDQQRSRRTNIAISRGGSRPSGAAASPRSSHSGLFSTRGRGNFPPCKALKTHEMRKFSPSSLRAKREMDSSHADKLGSAASPRGATSRRVANAREGPCALRTHAARGGGSGAAASGRRRKKDASPQKFGETSLGDLEACNPLKYHKTAKVVWKSLDENALDLRSLEQCNGGCHYLAGYVPRRRAGLEQEARRPETDLGSEL